MKTKLFLLLGSALFVVSCGMKIGDPKLEATGGRPVDYVELNELQMETLGVCKDPAEVALVVAKKKTSDLFNPANWAKNQHIPKYGIWVQYNSGSSYTGVSGPGYVNISEKIYLKSKEKSGVTQVDFVFRVNLPSAEKHPELPPKKPVICWFHAEYNDLIMNNCVREQGVDCDLYPQVVSMKVSAIKKINHFLNSYDNEFVNFKYHGECEVELERIKRRTACNGGWQEFGNGGWNRAKISGLTSIDGNNITF